MPSTIPRVLLVGVGHFGRSHLQEWLKLAQEGRVELAGLVVGTEASRERLLEDTSLPVHVGFHIGLLQDDIDAVDIVTPASTHFDLATACLPHVHVLVEKPLCETPQQAQKLFNQARESGRTLMVGHIFRHHPLTVLWREKLRTLNEPVEQVEITFTNPADELLAGLDPFLEWIHAFDLLDEAADSDLRSCQAWQYAQLAETSVVTSSGTNAILRFGWSGTERVRRVRIASANYRLKADYDDGILTTKRMDTVTKDIVGPAPGALRTELIAFLGAITGQENVTPTPRQVIASLENANRARNSAYSKARRSGNTHERPRVAVIGGGVFGTTCALELSNSCDVSIFERHEKLLNEASYYNQWRHHSGFHYPRSVETIQEIQLSKKAFEAVYEKAILRDIDAYFSVSALGNEISRERYLATCEANQLDYSIIPPPADIVYPEKSSVCLHTDESVVDIDRLTRIIQSRIKASGHVAMHLDSAIVSGKLLADGRKALTIRSAGSERTEEFDFLINASYANSNIVANWFNFPMRPLRFDRLELAVFRIPGAPRFMMTLLDAPFTSLTSLGHGDLFMLSHIEQSILESRVTDDGLPPKWSDTPLNHENLLRHGLRYLPILKNAEYVESRIGIRTVEAYSLDYDGRPTVVTHHGFGCWSMLGGKIITAVTNAREIVAAIERQS